LFRFLYCFQLTWYLLVVVPMLPIAQHGLFKDPPSFIAICTPQGLAVKATCMQDCRRSISRACIGQELLPFQFSTVFVYHLVARPESLGVIAWLLHCCSLAFCAQGMAGARPCLIVAMKTPKPGDPKKYACWQNSLLSVCVFGLYCSESLMHYLSQPACPGISWILLS
jgi:hypothetical protein